VEQLVGFGPRPSGTEALAKSGDYIVASLRAAGLEVEVQRFVKPTPRGETTFRNIIGRTSSAPSHHRKIVVFGSHYDTKWMPDITFVGANDAGSSTGALLEMARVTANQPDVWFVFFDGEECMESYSATDGLWGSKHFATELVAGRPVKTGDIGAFVLLDMVGDADLTVTVPPSSTGWLALGMFDAARELGWRDRFSYAETDIIDDHTPMVAAGIASVNLIDFQFGSAAGQNDYWHTHQDTLDRVSARSLEIVGRTALRWLANYRQTTVPP
jgi:Zn-dependent M28 family amino/carboxypeptidase